MIKRLIRLLINRAGFDIQKITNRQLSRAGGDMSLLLLSLKKRGLTCTGILDIGANSGEWSRTAKSVFKEADVYLIEPQKEMVPYLEQVVADFPGSKYFLAGAGATDGSLVLTVWDDLAGSSFLPKTDAVNLSDNQRRVSIITVDKLLVEKKIKMPELIKLDIQGFELEALKGATETFGKTEVYIVEVSLFNFEHSENAPSFYEVIKFMEERDYVVYDFPGFLNRPFDGALGQCDICFAKRNGVLRMSNKW